MPTLKGPTVNSENFQRKSFASLESKVHPDANLAKFDFLDPSITLDKSDLQIASELVEILEKISTDKFANGCGEWNWLQNNKQSNFIAVLNSKNIENIANKLRCMFKNDATYGYLSPSFLDVKTNLDSVKSDILANVDTCFEFTKIDSIDKLGSPPNVGSPYGLKLQEQLIILPDTPRHYYYAFNIKEQLYGNISPFIIEVGGGYGGLCKIIKTEIPGATICDIDLLPPLITAYYYLRKSGKAVQFIDDISQVQVGKVNLLPSDLFDSKKKSRIRPNLVFNSRSLCEMSEVTCSKYIDFVNKSDAEYFYHENSNFVLFPDSERHIELMADSFNVNTAKYNLSWKCITPFTGGKGRYREYMFALDS